MDSLEKNKPAIQILTEPERYAEKNRLYLAIREREGRVLSDAQVLGLPHFLAEHPNQQKLQQEWIWRARSLRRFQNYLKKRFRNQPLQLLDLGCGNGWMALNLAKRPNTEVHAVDVNLPELEQGARIAAATGQTNIQFVFADVLDNQLPEAQFDLIVLAASVQYFPDLKILLAALKRLLRTGGEIHFLDSPFYPTEAERRRAQAGSQRYYSNLGYPEMAQWYHHHLWADMAALGGKNLNADLYPSLLQLFKILPPFPWAHVPKGLIVTE